MRGSTPACRQTHEHLECQLKPISAADYPGAVPLGPTPGRSRAARADLPEGRVRLHEAAQERGAVGAVAHLQERPRRPAARPGADVDAVLNRRCADSDLDRGHLERSPPRSGGRADCRLLAALAARRPPRGVRAAWLAPRRSRCWPVPTHYRAARSSLRARTDRSKRPATATRAPTPAAPAIPREYDSLAPLLAPHDDAGGHAADRDRRLRGRATESTARWHYDLERDGRHVLGELLRARLWAGRCGVRSRSRPARITCRPTG